MRLLDDNCNEVVLNNILTNAIIFAENAIKVQCELKTWYVRLFFTIAVSKKTVLSVDVLSRGIFGSIFNSGSPVGVNFRKDNIRLYLHLLSRHEDLIGA
jgi:hypothetical protein